MLRMLVLLLLVANGVYFAWSQDWLSALGWAPVQPSEPQRLERQIEPERVRLLTPDEVRQRAAGASAAAASPALPASAASAASAASPASAASGASAASAAAVVTVAETTPVKCLRAGLFDAQKASTLRAALEAAGLPPDSWTLENGTVPGQWIVYTGRLASVAARNKLREELRAMKLPVEPLANGSLEPGLALGTYLSEAAAKAAQQMMSRRGVRDTRVVEQRPEKKGQWLRLPAADSALSARVQALPALAGQTLQTCR